MVSALRFLFPLDRYVNPTQRIRATGIYIFCTIIFITRIVIGGQAAAEWLSQTPTPSILPVLAQAALVVVAVVSILLTRSGQQQIAARVVLVSWIFFGTVSLFFNFLPGVYAHLIGLTVAALVLDTRGVIAVAVASIGSMIFVGITFPDSIPPVTSLTNAIGVALVESVICFGLARGIDTVDKQVQASNEQRVRLAEMNSTIAQRLLTERLDLNTTLELSAELVRDALPTAHVAQIFLLDSEQRQAMLAVSTDRNQRPGKTYGIASLNVIGRAALGNQPILIRNMLTDSSLRRTTFLDGMMSELATPLRVGQRTIGVLDVQSRKADAFPESEFSLLKTLADQMALVLDNARLFAETREQFTENQRLLDQTRLQLREIERLNQQLTGGIWAEFLRAQDQIPASTIDFTTGQTQPTAEWTRTMLEAARHNQLGVQQVDNFKTIAIPISVRGQAIGAMEFELGLDQEISDEQIDLMKQVLERVGFAVENTRLFEETQYFAQREALVNEISTRLQANTSVEAVLAAAAQSLADALRAPHVAIRLGTPETSGDNGHAAT